MNPPELTPTSHDESTHERLAADFRTVIARAEEVLKTAGSQTGEKFNEAKQRLEESLKSARVKLDRAEAAVVARAKQAARATDNYVHDNPWKAIGISAGVGIVVGLLIGRR